MSGAELSGDTIDAVIRHLKAGLELVPAHMRSGMLGFVQHGWPTGGFLQTLLDGDLKGAAGRADLANLAALDSWSIVLRSHLPNACHGSPENRLAWIKSGGLEGRRAKEGTT